MQGEKANENLQARCTAVAWLSSSITTNSSLTQHNRYDVIGVGRKQEGSCQEQQLKHCRAKGLWTFMQDIEMRAYTVLRYKGSVNCSL